MMGWSKIHFAEGFDSADCRWIKTAFQQLYESAGEEDYDTLALYLDLRPAKGVTLILSPAGTERLRAAAHFGLIDCERPDADNVAVVIGLPIASDPGYIELPPAERAEEREEVYFGWLEDAGYFEAPERFGEQDLADPNVRVVAS